MTLLTLFVFANLGPNFFVKFNWVQSSNHFENTFTLNQPYRRMTSTNVIYHKFLFTSKFFSIIYERIIFYDHSEKCTCEA